MGLLDSLLNRGKRAVSKELRKQKDAILRDLERGFSGTTPAQSPPKKRTSSRRKSTTRKRTSSGRTRPDPRNAPPFSVGEMTRWDNGQWYPAGTSVSVAGVTIPNGMVYVGDILSQEPSLIEQDLPVATTRATDLKGTAPYDKLTPNQRGTYLRWLAQGRQAAPRSAGYAHLWLDGVERRVYVDLRDRRDANNERRELFRELRRVRGLVAPTYSDIAQRISVLMDSLAVGIWLEDSSFAIVPDLDVAQNNVPAMVQVQVADAARRGLPLAHEWALAWAWTSPSSKVWTAATRCANEVKRLFAIRYREAYGSGMTLDPVRGRLDLSPRVWNWTLGRVRLPVTQLSDVTATDDEAVRSLIALFESVIDELDAYSRWLGRKLSDRSSLQGHALLPVALIDMEDDHIAQLSMWVESRLTASSGTVVPGSDLLAQWTTGNEAPARLSKADSIAFATVLGYLAIGIEPDVRFNGTPLSAETPVVLFAQDVTEPVAPTAEYGIATTISHLATAVGASDGVMTDAEIAALANDIGSQVKLSISERNRLRAHVQWLASQEITLRGFRSRVESLDAGQRERIGDMLVQVAIADDAITPREISMLTRIYTVLGLDADGVTSRVHHTLTGMPQMANGAAAAGSAAVRTSDTLDPDLIVRTQRETADVSRLLGDIFMEDEQSTDAPQSDVQMAADVETIGTLDGQHSAVLREVIGQGTWTRDGFDALAASHGLMPAGALDTINEFALEEVGEPLLEGDDDLTLNEYVREELAL